MKLKRVEIAIISVTLAFACFTGGYFAGRRSPVNIIPVEAGSGAASESAARDTPALPDAVADEPEPSALPLETEGVVTADTADMEETAETAAPSDDTGNQEASDAVPETQEAPEQGETELGAPYGGDMKIDINSASKTELTDLPGIGEVLAGRIIEYREKNGKFRSISDITKVSGIGEKKFEAMRDYICAE